jgi:hypothetical protein
MREVLESSSQYGGYALSLKQPWAALLVHRHKTIEIRSWRTLYRGPVLIHAARVPDLRREAWALVPDEIYRAAQKGGRIVGAGVLTDCVAYGSAQAFGRDAVRHLNPATWLREPGLYGFVFTDIRRLPFQPCPGSVRFFTIEDGSPSRARRNVYQCTSDLFDRWAPS